MVIIGQDIISQEMTRLHLTGCFIESTLMAAQNDIIERDIDEKQAK